MKRKKLILDKAIYQGVRNYSCPECDYDFILKDRLKYMLGYGKTRNRFGRKKSIRQKSK